jgi:hypothetical protein
VITGVVQAVDDPFAGSEGECEEDTEFFLGAATGKVEPSGVGLAPIPEMPSDAVAGVFCESALRGGGVRWKDRSGLVIHVYLDVHEPLLNEKSGDAIAKRVVAFAESDLTPLARQLEAHQFDNLIDACLASRA